MKSKIIKFKLAYDNTHNSIEFSAYMAPNKTKVTWFEDGIEQSTSYSTSKVKHYFKNGIWVKQ